MRKAGIYIHVPFCSSKCPYCDFYSVCSNDELKDRYTEKAIEEMKKYESTTADTIYLGGGTPSVLGGNRLKKLIESAKEIFSFESGEITVEINPSSCNKKLLNDLFSVGVNRISMGVQSAVDEERKILGRQTDIKRISEIIREAKNTGFENISLDLMIGVPKQTKESLEKSLEYCVSSGATHISVYMLKIEEGTAFFKIKDKLCLPNEDEVCDFYENSCDYLEKHGFHQYEISNFSLSGKESRHNLKYWRCEEYIGIGPSAHSFLNGKRYYHSRDIKSYLTNCNITIPDGDGGSFEEYAMLKLRLDEGMNNSEVRERFLFDIPKTMFEKSRKFVDAGLVISDGESIRLTKKGFLLSNTVISEIIL